MEVMTEHSPWCEKEGLIIKGVSDFELAISVPAVRPLKIFSVTLTLGTLFHDDSDSPLCQTAILLLVMIYPKAYLVQGGVRFKIYHIKKIKGPKGKTN
jgi:hypothetical protein